MAHEIAEKLVSAVESRDADALAELFAEDGELHHPLNPEPVRGRMAIAASEQALFDAFSDIDVDVVRVVADGVDVVIELVIRATNTGPLDVGVGETVPPTGRRIDVPSVWFLTLGPDGRIVEERDYLDTATVVGQLMPVSEM